MQFTRGLYPCTTQRTLSQGFVPIKPLPRYYDDQIMNTQNVPHRSQQTEVRIDVDA